MSVQMNVFEAKAKLSELIEAALAGDEVLIARAGRPVVKLVPVGTPAQDRVPGSAKGEAEMSADFEDELPAELLASFEK